MLVDIGVIIAVYTILKLIEMSCKKVYIQLDNGYLIHYPSVIIIILNIIGIIAIIVFCADLFNSRETLEQILL